MINQWKQWSVVTLFSLLTACSQVSALKQTMARWIEHDQVRTAGLNGQSIDASTTNWSTVDKQAIKEIVVHFAYDHSTLTPEVKKILQQQAKNLLANVNQDVQVAGHTDERGSREYNLALGWRRARAVTRYLVQQGVPFSRLDSMSYGKEKPVDLGHDARSWAHNRRVVLRFMATNDV